MAIRYGTTKGAREILFTFDDGPNPKTTPKLLDALAAHDIKAMFFVLGERIASTEGRGIMERAHREEKDRVASLPLTLPRFFFD